MLRRLPLLRSGPTAAQVATLYTAWLSIAAAEVALARVSAGAPSVGGALAEVGILAAFATVHALVLGRLPATRGPLAPGVLLLLVTAVDAIAGRGLVQRRYPLSPGDLLLAGLLLGLAGEWLERRFPRLAPMLGAAVAPLWAVLASLEVGYYLGGRSTAFHAGLDAAPWMLPAAAVVVAAAWVRPRVAPLVAASAAVVLAVPLPHSPAPPSAEAQRRPNVVLITVDTLRADEASRMETFRRLAARGETFTDALAPSGWTLPSMASITTGTWPQTHGANRQSDKWPSHGTLRPDLVTLAQTFRQGGYATAAVVTNPNLAETFGFRRGITHWRNLFKDPPSWWFGVGLFDRTPDLAPAWASPYDGGLIVDDAISWLERRPNDPFFLWVHTLDNHLPYFHARIPPTSPLFETFGPRPGKRLDVQMLRMGRLWGHAPVKDAMLDLYRQEIAYTDGHLADLLDWLEAHGKDQDTLFVFTSDHGEEFLEHGSWEHGHTLYEELVHVPFVLSRPGGPAGVLREDPASLVDIYPTLVALAGLTPPPHLEGRSLVDPVPADRPRHLLGNLYDHWEEGVVVGKWKLLKADRVDHYRLLDRTAGELGDQSAVAPEVVEQLRPLLLRTANGGAAGDLDLEGLKALGYTD